jgi:hypothetical protein
MQFAFLDGEGLQVAVGEEIFEAGLALRWIGIFQANQTTWPSFIGKCGRDKSMKKHVSKIRMIGIRRAVIVLICAAVAAVSLSGCIVADDHEGGWHHEHWHEHYWDHDHPY